MTGIIYALVAMFGFGLSNGIMKVPARKMSGIKNILYRNIITSTSIGIAILFMPYYISWKYIAFAVFVSVVGYIPLLTFYKALEKSDIGIVSPVANSAIVFTVIFSVILFGESLNIRQVLAIGVILAGIIFTSIDLNNFRRQQFMKSGIPFALITCVLWGLFFAISKVPINVLGPILSSFIFEFCGAVIAFFHLKLRKEKLDIPEGLITYLLYLGIFGAVAAVSYNIGLSKSDISIVAAVTLANPIVAVMYGRIVYKEKLSLQQMTAIIVTIAGIIALSYFS